MRLALEGAFETAASPAAAATPAPSQGTRLAWLVAAVGLVVPAVQHLREAPPAVATETRTEIVTPATSDVSTFALSPDGRQAEGPTEPDGIFLGAIGSATTTRLTASTTAGTYLPPGWLLWVREGTLVAQRLDLDRLALTGDQLTLADEVAVNDGTSHGTVAVSASGLIAYRTGKVRQ